MADLLRVSMKWSGFTGAPGYTNFHFRDFSTTGSPTAADAISATDRVESFIGTIKSLLPNVVNLAVEGDCAVISAETGNLVTVYNGAPAAAQVGTGGVGAYAAPVGAVVTWRTSVVRNNRRIRGRSFIVPTAATAQSTDGSLASTAATTLSTAAAALIDQTGTPDLCVWARPTGPGLSDGTFGIVESFSVPDIMAVLRSRRD